MLRDLKVMRQILIDRLRRDFPLFEEHHEVDVDWSTDRRQISISYDTSHPLMGDVYYESTRFYLHIIGDVSYSSWLEIEPKHRGKGHGKTLYKIWEDFSRDCGCQKLHGTPTGHVRGKSKLEYLESLGFHKVEEGDLIVAEKLLT